MPRRRAVPPILTGHVSRLKPAAVHHLPAHVKDVSVAVERAEDGWEECYEGKNQEPLSSEKTFNL